MTADRIPTEHEEQRELVRWFRQTWPGVRIYAIPNGGALHDTPKMQTWIGALLMGYATAIRARGQA